MITEDPAQAAETVLDLCNPGDGSLVDPLVGNPRRVQERFEEDFEAPIAVMLASLMIAESAPNSPIVEALGIVAATQDRSRPRGVVVVSDMLQNSPAQSHYRHSPDATAILATDVGASLADGRLNGAVIAFVMLPNALNKARQDRRLTSFWRSLVESAGAISAPLEQILTTSRASASPDTLKR